MIAAIVGFSRFGKSSAMLSMARRPLRSPPCVSLREVVAIGLVPRGKSGPVFNLEDAHTFRFPEDATLRPALLLQPPSESVEAYSGLTRQNE